MPDVERFEAGVDAARGDLRLAGDCRALDLESLQRALGEWRRAGAKSLDLTGVGQFDIGPAWLLQRALQACAADGPAPSVTGTLPSHFAYLDELVADTPDTAQDAQAESDASWLTRFGRALHERFHSWYEALTYGGLIIATAGLAWRSLKRLRIPSVVRHAYETGYQAVPVVALIAFLISVIIAYLSASQLRNYGADIYVVDLITRRRAARARRAAHGDHRGGPHRQRVRRRDRRR